MSTYRKHIRSLALAFVLALGAMTAWFFMVAFFAVPFVDEWFPTAYPAVTKSLVILHDGTPVIDSHEAEGEGPYYPIYHTLDGKRIRGKHPLDASLVVPFEDGRVEYVLRDVPFEERAWSSILAARVNDAEPFAKLDWSVRLVQLDRPRLSTALWYFIHDGTERGRGYFVGYDEKTKHKIGYIERDDFRPDEPTLEEQFPVAGRRMGVNNALLARFYYGSPQDHVFTNLGQPRDLPATDPWTVCLLADDGLMRINVKEHTAAYLLKDANIISAALGFENPTAPVTAQDAVTRQIILVRTPERILALNFRGKELYSYRLPTELRDRTIEWLQLPNNKALVRTYGISANDASTALPQIIDSDNELFWIDATGKIIRHERVDLSWRMPPVSTAQETITGCIMAPPPVLVMGFGLWDPWSAGNQPKSLDYFGALRNAIADWWPALAFVTVISIILAFMCYRRQRKYGLPWTPVWTVFVLLFGLPAYFGYLAHRNWPARLPCPHCGRLAPRDRPACFACGRDFPSPQPKGIEVFA